MKLIKTVTIDNPPTKYVINKKRPKIDKKTGKLITETVYYLTANLFYSKNLHYAVQKKIVGYCKDILMVMSQPMPKIEKCRIKCIYHHPTDTFDLDNKAYFWTKLFLDILKTPSTRQQKNAILRNSRIKTLEAIEDDTVRFIDDINMKYEKGPSKLVFEIWGREKDEQKELLL